MRKNPVFLLALVASLGFGVIVGRYVGKVTQETVFAQSCGDYVCDEYEECWDDCNPEVDWCGDWTDNDEDGDEDCEDEDCDGMDCDQIGSGGAECDYWGTGECIETDCADASDNDDDGDEDCDDDDCDGLPCATGTCSGWACVGGGDSTPPTVSTYNPTDNATDVAITANLILTFDENVDPEAGASNDIIIKKTSDDSTIETIDAQSGNVTGGGTSTITINPTSDLTNSIEYYVQIGADAFDDTAGNSYAGISSTTTWSFTTVAGGGDSTPPEPAASNPLSPADNATGIAVDANLVINFNENVDPETGASNDITIKKTSDDSTFEAIDAMSGQVTGGGTSAITINPSIDFTNSIEYYVLIGADAFDDTAGNSYAGISSTTEWSYTIVAGGGGSTCGDGSIEGIEVCDDGGWCGGTVDGTHCISDAECPGTCQPASNDGCSSDCSVEENGTCGNGYVEWRGEICDDGNTTDGDGCDSSCQVECTGASDCTSYPIQESPCWCNEYNAGNCYKTVLVSTCTTSLCNTTVSPGLCTPQGGIVDGGSGSPSAICDNDGTTDAGETCSNCPYDVRCDIDEKCLAGACSGTDWECKREEICGDGWVSGSEECDDGGICTGSSVYSGMDCMSIDTADGGRAGVARCRVTGGICVAQGDDGCSADCSERCAPVGDPCLLDADCCTGESCTNGLCVSGGGGEDSCFPGDSTKTAVFIDNSGPTMLCPGIDGQTIDMAYNSSSEQWEGSSTFCNGLWTTTFKDAGSCAYELDLSTTSPCATAFTGATDSDPPEPPFSFTPFNISGGAEAPTCPVSCCTETSWDMEVVIPAGEDSCFPGVTTKTLTFDDQSVGPKCPGLDNKTVDMTYNTSNSRWEGTADYCNSTFTALFRDAGSCAYELNLSTVGDCNVSLDWTGDFNPPEPPWSYAPVGMGACTVACCPTGGSDSFYLEIP